MLKQILISCLLQFFFFCVCVSNIRAEKVLFLVKQAFKSLEFRMKQSIIVARSSWN